MDQPTTRNLTHLPDLGTSAGRVGPVRLRMPIYVDLLPPCNNACPAGENIQEWLRLVKAKDDLGAWRELTRNNPFPAIHGRVCYHPCETACNRIELDGAVSIHSVERFLGDAARTARRLGAEESIVVYRRTQEQMPAHAEEHAEAVREGVKMNWLRTINQFDEGQMQVEIMELDESGKARGTGRFETLEADTVILALGQEADSGFLQSIPGMSFDGDTVNVDPTTLMTDVPGIFAGGDAVPSERTVTVGVGHGKKAAKMIDLWLSNMPAIPKEARDLASFDKLNLWYWGDNRRTSQPELAIAARKAFDEVVGGLTEDEARTEAWRCLSCGNCIECDGCLGSCPEDAVIKLGKGNRYRYDYAKCTGCGTCYEQCPVHAIDMIAER